MILTEKEAKNRKCHQTMTAIPLGSSQRGETLPEFCPSFCMASECMAWRWDPEFLEGTNIPTWKDGIRRGFCGLAGKPDA